jgi:hypothetical protein
MPRVTVEAFGGVVGSGKKPFEVVLVENGSCSDALEVIDTDGLFSSFTGLLQSGQQHCSQDRNDRNNDQKFDKGKNFCLTLFELLPSF